jgi:DNA-binding response OmpR family regulator
MPRPLVLVVEDDEQVLGVFARVVEHGGYECVKAANGHRVEGQLKGRSPSAVILDYLLPGMPSTEIIARLRLASPLVPIIVVTATTASDEELGRLVPFAILRKPFSVDELLTVLERAIEGSGPVAPA